GWIGRVVDGHIEIERENGTTDRLRATDLEPLLDHAPAQTTSWTTQRAPRNPLRDREAGEQLLRNGWYRLPLLDADTVEALREGYGEVHGWTQAPTALGPDAFYEPDPGNPDFEYRARSTALVSGMLESTMRPIFDDFEPFLWGFYCKWPHGEATALHWDWTCVDSRLGHRSYQIWVALDDVDEANGGFAFLTGSHNLLSSPCGSGLSSPSSDTFLQRTDDAIAKCESLRMRAGEALIFDHRILHITHPNTTDRPRLACVAAWRPAEADLVHYQRVSDNVAIRYRADAWWFRNMVPGNLGSVGPSLELSEVVFLDDDLEAPADVGAFLDQVS
ncbi:MAG TPA: phytanoyl-CoA dioxygenase family protein, partial [Acidimicrobiales bacterium]|nr:phytanoyl-CoA dioxygenase family protein [Acidimicrobiales bacterium]